MPHPHGTHAGVGLERGRSPSKRPKTGVLKRTASLGWLTDFFAATVPKRLFQRGTVRESFAVIGTGPVREKIRRRASKFYDSDGSLKTRMNATRFAQPAPSTTLIEAGHPCPAEAS